MNEFKEAICSFLEGILEVSSFSIVGFLGFVWSCIHGVLKWIFGVV